MTEFVPYTYLIGWTKLNKWYYGVEYANNLQRVANPRNLFNTYFTSSRTVSDLIKKVGNPDVISVRKTFASSDEAREWEHKVLRRMQVIHKDQWINMTNNRAIVFERTEEYLAKLRKPKLSYTVSERSRAANKARGIKLRGSRRPPRTDEWSNKIAEGRKGLIWVNNGIESKQVRGEIPAGWKRGRNGKSSL